MLIFHHLSLKLVLSPFSIINFFFILCRAPDIRWIKHSPWSKWWWSTKNPNLQLISNALSKRHQKNRVSPNVSLPPVNVSSKLQPWVSLPLSPTAQGYYTAHQLTNCSTIASLSQQYLVISLLGCPLSWTEFSEDQDCLWLQTFVFFLT